MKINVFLFCFIFSSFSFAQKGDAPVNTIPYAIAQERERFMDQKFCKSSFQTINAGKASTEDNLKDFLRQKISNLNIKGVSLLLQSKVESMAGIHFTFAQLFKEKRIFRAQVKVNMDAYGNIISVFDNTVEIIDNTDDFTPFINVASSLNLTEIADDYKKEFIFFSDEKGLYPALHLEIVKEDNYYELIYGSEGKIIYRNNLALYFMPPLLKDSIVSGNVFLPDPLTTAGVTYGSPYTDSIDNDSPQLTAELKQVNFLSGFDTVANLFRLESPYIKINEHSSPTVTPVTSAIPDFSFTRSQSGFEDVNVFYHISNFHNYLQELGFTNLMNYQIYADAHALSGQDNSNFVSFFNPPRLNFGEGGVDDAEDSDVVIHEYCHGVSHSASPGTNFGTERTALDEALGDYFASSYSRSINPFGWENVFSWDGHNEFWPGRMSITTDHYPEDLQNDLYADADIWSSVMMKIWEDIGRENTDKLQIQALYGYASNMTMSDAAQLVIQADSLLNGGAFYNQICARFYNSGLVNVCGNAIHENYPGESRVNLLNSEKFCSENGFVLLQFNNSVSAKIQVCDVAGKIIFSENIFAKEYKIDSKNMAKGMYILHVLADDNLYVFKLLR